ncbi:hypothetical protein ACFY12_30920 [Streptomyces sp. NPDC001339]|uniref:hypothetical protein n=1 Tax=Streptomyces sp. NPDC001339 TaxID=3364563 RepID=UPI0036B80356
MSFPPPPPSHQPNQPNQPPHNASGGFGPPVGGYGPPPGGGQATGGFGPPAGGYGPPGPGGPAGPGGWQAPPPGPPGGGGNGKVIAAIIGGGAVVLAAVITVIVMVNSGDDSTNRAQPSSSSSATASTSATPSAYPSSPGPSAGRDDETSGPTPSSSTIPFYRLRAGDCFDRPVDGSGKNTAMSCDGPHDAEVVTTHQLESGLTTQSEIQRKAASLCLGDLQRKAARQPAGTAEGSYYQFPTVDSYQFGTRFVSCSLMADRTGTKKLTKPLS